MTTVAAALLVACSPGGSGDKLAPFQGSVLGDGRSLSSLNQRVNDDGSPNPPPGLDAVVTVTGARVTWIDQYDETRDGKGIGNVYLQDFASVTGPHQGITAFQSTYAPPSFRASVGDVVDITGQYMEYQLDKASTPDRLGWTMPEFKGGTIRLRFDAPYIPIVPVEIPLTDLLDYSTGRQWLSMVVTLKGVRFSGEGRTTPDGRTVINISHDVPHIPEVSNALFDLAGHLEQVKQERGLAKLSGLEADITGIVSETFTFQIAPRSADDIVIR